MISIRITKRIVSVKGRRIPLFFNSNSLTGTICRQVFPVTASRDKIQRFWWIVNNKESIWPIMSEPPLKRKRSTILDYFQMTSNNSKSKAVEGKEGKDDSKGNQEANMASCDGSDGVMTSKNLQGSEPGSGTGKKANKNDELQKTSKKKSESQGTEQSQAMSSKCSCTTGEQEESSPTPDDDCCDPGPEDCMNSQSNGDFLSSSRAIPNKKPTPKKDGSQACKGTPVKVMKKMPACEGKLGPLKDSDTHVVLFQTPYEYKEESPSPPKPYSQYKDKWDHYHVRMPCSNQNEYPVQEKHGHGKKITRRWDIITRAYSRDIKDIFELEDAILSYNSRYYEKWNFETLHYFFTEDLVEEERHEFFSKTMKTMQKLAQKLPHLCSHPIPLLKKGQSKSVTFSQQQIASLLANAFFCTFPQRNTKRFSEFSKFPSINFSSLFTGKPDSMKMEKLRCILHYFKRVCEKTPCGTVTISRRWMHKSELPDWDKMETHLSGLHVSSEGTIEDDGEGMLQVDFANKFVGGGVLGHGCVQEEIRFLICPEMIISRLITEELDPNEALVMKGCERFSDYDGYSNTFKWKESYIDKTNRDNWGRMYCEVVAIDAYVFRNYKDQFQHSYVQRELDKAFCGFFTKLPPDQLPAVCTGNWGCGAFGGDRRLKALIQLMAAAYAKRDVCYFTFDDEKLRDDLHQIHIYITVTNPLAISDLLKIIEQYRKNVIIKSQGKPEMNIFQFILKTFDMSPENTDGDSCSSNEMRSNKEAENETSCSSRGSVDGVTVDADWESKTTKLLSNTPARVGQDSQEDQGPNS